MRTALFIVIVLGAGIGLLMPVRESPSPAEAPRAAAAATPSAPSSPPPSMPPRETVLERSDGGHFYAHVEVNGQLVRFLVDTGATTVALTEADATRIGIPFSPSEFVVVGEGAAGPVNGKRVRLNRVSLDGKEVTDVAGVILQGGTISLLGQAYLGQFAVAMRGDEMRIS